ncbi:MAG: hypothetical protein R6X34_29375 [Chloroflexota bacterium]
MNASSMDTTSESHAFVIRIWLEDAQSDENSTLWRGHITHVLDHRRHYFQDLSSIIHFITPYLDVWTVKGKT